MNDGEHIEALIERAARGLRAARDFTPRQERDCEFIFRELVPDGLVALDELRAFADEIERLCKIEDDADRYFRRALTAEARLADPNWCYRLTGPADSSLTGERGR